MNNNKIIIINNNKIIMQKLKKEIQLIEDLNKPVYVYKINLCCLKLLVNHVKHRSRSAR